MREAEGPAGQCGQPVSHILHNASAEPRERCNRASRLQEVATVADASIGVARTCRLTRGPRIHDRIEFRLVRSAAAAPFKLAPLLQGKGHMVDVAFDP